jgi:hypothetical protein
MKKARGMDSFSNYVEDSGGSVSRLDAKSTLNASASLAFTDEPELDWIPGDARTLAHEFRLQHGNDLSPALIAGLLKDLNKIWGDRERK